MPALGRRGKLLVLHYSVKENFSILCDVLQLSSADKITAKLVKNYFSDKLKFSKLSSADKIAANLVKNYISVKLKFSKYPLKHQRSLAITAGCLVGLICLGTNHSCALACLPLAVISNSAQRRKILLKAIVSEDLNASTQPPIKWVVNVRWPWAQWLWCGSATTWDSKAGEVVCPLLSLRGLLSHVCFFRILAAFPHPNPILLQILRLNCVLNSEN